MNVQQVRKWLETNCKDMSIMWRMHFTGVVQPRDEKFLNCYNILVNEIKPNKEKVKGD